MKQTSPKNYYWQLLPLAGVATFAVLYVIAACLYPGGTPDDATTKGFSWLHNYWCNLLNETALNGQPNIARPIAFTAMVVLAVSLVAFWFLFPLQVGFGKRGRWTMQASGLLAMLTALALSTPLHDVAINVASGFGLVALTGTFIGLHRLGWKRLFWMGIFNLVLIGLNNLCYYGPGLWMYLPVVQKVTFLYFLSWVGLVNWRLYERQALDRAGNINGFDSSR